MIAHVGGLPIEETIALGGPTLLVAFGAASATLRARLRARRARRYPPVSLLVVAVFASMALASAPASAGDGRFGAGADIDVAGAYSVAVGDFNADGRPDLAAASVANGHVRVRLGAAGGGFKPAPNAGVGGFPRDMVIADFDADGTDDLAVVNQDDKGVSVRLGDGDGTFTAASEDIEFTTFPRSLAVGDFDGDNREDLAIVVASPVAARIAVRLGDGDGTFTDAGEFGNTVASLAVGDFNADGIEDLVSGEVGTRNAVVFNGKGGGGFAIGDTIELPGPTSAIAVADFDADGKLDLSAAIQGNDVVSVRLGDGDGSFTGGPDLPAGGPPVAPTVGDFDSDGSADLAFGNLEFGTVHVRLGDGAGNFASAADVFVDDGPLDLALADFDSDGNEDLAVANYDGDSVSVRPGLGPPPLAGNLLINGGFEGPGPAATSTQSPAIPGWQRTGGMTYARYGLPSHLYLPSRVAAPRYLTGGLSFLWGGSSTATGGLTEAFQTVDVSAAAASIDAGRAQANLSAHLGGAVGLRDRMSARAAFENAAGQMLGSFQIGPVTAADRHALTTLVRRAGSAAVPRDTRRIRVTLTSVDEDKIRSSATADNVRLTLDTAPPDPPPPPPVATFGSDTKVTVRLKAGRIARRGPIPVRITNANAFDVTGILTGRTTTTVGTARKTGKLRSVRLALAATSHRTVRLALSKTLRRQLKHARKLAVRLSLKVADPTGNRRTVRKRVSPRLRRDRDDDAPIREAEVRRTAIGIHESATESVR